ncbi:MAG: hypothetical protein Q8R76_07590 [Candidatus Omnitrophota bacterium]|nr:hypothetical protein [Candidatus Omnitrophota bacterium]
MTFERDRAEITITDFRDSIRDDVAYTICFDVRGPGRRLEALRVSFSEEFMEQYFRVPWNKDLAAEEMRLEKERRNLFVAWGLLKVEEMIKNGFELKEVVLSGESDLKWARKVEAAKLRYASEPQGNDVFIYHLG